MYGYALTEILDSWVERTAPPQKLIRTTNEKSQEENLVILLLFGGVIKVVAAAGKPQFAREYYQSLPELRRTALSLEQTCPGGRLALPTWIANRK
jgi:hypothetical protein